LLQTYGELVTQERAAAAILLSAEYDETPQEAVRRIREFLEHAQSIGAILQRAG
jgi:hypothetical protein